MPKVNYIAPAEQRALTKELTASYGGMLTLSTVGRLLGIKNRASVAAWLSDVRGYEVNGRTRYMTADVARKLWEGRA